MAVSFEQLHGYIVIGYCQEMIKWHTVYVLNYAVLDHLQ